MSLYRQAGRRSGWLAVAVVVALLVGFGIGFAVARATAEEPTVEEAVASVQEEAGITADALELVAIHYETTEAAAGQQLQRAEESFDEARPDLQLLAPEETTEAGQAIERLATLVDQSASAEEVERAAEEARTAVRQAAGLR
jgi:recombinational DNA repair protein (RecF pathway)